jgi:hypothetical protein
MVDLRRLRVLAAGLALAVIGCNGSGTGTRDGSAGTTGTGGGGRGGTTGLAGTTGAAGTTGSAGTTGAAGGVGGDGGGGGGAGGGGGTAGDAGRGGSGDAGRGGSGDAGRGGSGGAGRGGSGGAGRGGSGGAGRGGSGGGGGTAMPACPSAPPQAGGPCAGQSCFYEDCAGVGRTAAHCTNAVWVVELAPCAAPTCPGIGGSLTCSAGQICSQRAGGAVEPAECVPNGCGTGPLACDCLRPCQGTCTVTGSAATGFLAFCNTCPQLLCP